MAKSKKFSSVAVAPSENFVRTPRFARSTKQLGSGAELTRRTENRKLTHDAEEWPISVTRAAAQTCPPCPLHKLCYGKGGPTGLRWRKLTIAAELAKLTPAQITKNEADRVLAQWPRDGRALRIHEVGDCATDHQAATLARAVTIAQSEGAGPAFTYTHSFATITRNAWGPIAVLASCEDLDGIELAHQRGYAAAQIVPDFATHTGPGIPCPQTTGAAASCATCLLCTRDDVLHKNRTPILFEPHGQSKRKLAEQLAHGDLFT